jgi:hypothetical protein
MHTYVWHKVEPPQLLMGGNGAGGLMSERSKTRDFFENPSPNIFRNKNGLPVTLFSTRGSEGMRRFPPGHGFGVLITWPMWR